MITDKNQNPEQIARDKIDLMLKESGWIVLSKNEVDLGASKGVAVRRVGRRCGRGRMYQLFGAEMNGIINELNEALAA